ncbi:MAG: type II toxin-antitoxin system RelE/ParE family toxin [Acetobacteraceae bacterium]
MVLSPRFGSGRESVRGARAAGAGQSFQRQAAGEGVLEFRIDWGPGYRVYFGRDGAVLAILLTGGTKRRQQRDIETAEALWTEYKRRRTQSR